MTINIKDREVTLKKTMRSYIIYESITNKPFAPQGMTDIITYFYSVLLASDKDLVCTFDDFVDALDEDDTLIAQFEMWLTEVSKMDDALTKKKTTAKTPAKKTN